MSPYSQLIIAGRYYTGRRKWPRSGTFNTEFYRLTAATYLCVPGKGQQDRYTPLHEGTQILLNDCLDKARHAVDINGGLFRTTSNNRSARLVKPITPDSVYRLIRRSALAFDYDAGYRQRAGSWNLQDDQADA